MFLFKKRPRRSNLSMKLFARLDFARYGHSIFHNAPFKGAELDQSVKSLAVLDDLLEVIRKTQLSRDDQAMVVMGFGAYVGEVIRKHAKAKWHWVKFENALPHNESIAQFGHSISTSYILMKGSQNVVFPLGKVVKFLQNGREDSVESFAQVVIHEMSQAGHNE